MSSASVIAKIGLEMDFESRTVICSVTPQMQSLESVSSREDKTFEGSENNLASVPSSINPATTTPFQMTPH